MALAEQLKAFDVPIRFGIDAEKDPPHSAMIVDCRGFAARHHLADLRGVKGEMIIVRTREINLRRPIRVLHPRHPLYIVPRGDGFFMIGATMIESDERGRVTARALLELLGAAYVLHPAFAEAEVIEFGADVRPAFPDNLPRIRKRGSTIHVNGLFRHGFLLAPALVKRAAAVVLDDAFFRRSWMKIICNGELREVMGATLGQIMEELGLVRDVVATAVNGTFVPVSARAHTMLEAGDAVEVLAPMQGG